MTPRWQDAAWVVLAVAAVIGGVACAPVATAAAAGAAARGAVVAGVTGLAQIGLGRTVLRRWAPARLDAPGALGHALAVGVGLHAAALFPLFAAGVCTATGAGAVLALVVLAGLPGLRGLRGRPALPAWALLAAALLLAPAVFDALAPATDTDELSYLLAMPRLLARDGALPVGVLLPEAARPMPLQLVAVAPWALGGEAACRLWHLGLVGVLIGTIAARVKARGGQPVVAALALAGSWSVVREAGLAYNDLPVALWLVCAADAMLEGAWGWMALHAGLAFAAKYTAAPVCAGLYAVAAWDAWRQGSVRRLAAGLALAAAPVLPWWGRNAAHGVHPLFPFAGWPPVPGMDFVFMYAQKYGMGHGPYDTLLLPLRVVFRADPDSMVFYGRLSLAWLGLAAAPFWKRDADGAAARRLGFVALLGFTGWAMGAQILRYLLPTLGVAALLLGSARLPRAAWALLLIGGLPANLAPAWRHAASRAAVVVGAEDHDVYLTRELPAWPALRYAQNWIPTDQKVALLGAWAGYYVQQPYVLGSVEDHVPTRYHLALHGDDALHDLYRDGVRWLIVGDLPGVRKTYAFLDAGTFTAQFLKPKEQLDRLLLRDARRVFTQSHVSVWALDAPADTH